MILGQTAASTSPIMWAAIGVSGGIAILLLVVFFLVLLFRHLASVRQLTHAERVRTLEAGFPLEPAEEMKAHAKYMHNAFWFWMVFSVPAAALSAASTASAKVNESSVLMAIIWTGGATASIAAIAGATVLMLSTRSRHEDSDVLGKAMKHGKKNANASQFSTSPPRDD
jgi:NADH:ubiquinone oxidoreductase subunit 3 (subunit A)